MNEPSGSKFKEQTREALLERVSQILEAADRKNRPLTAVEDAAVMEIVKETQRLEVEGAESSRHKEQPRESAIEVKQRQRLDLLSSVAQILKSGRLDREAEVMDRIREAQGLEAEICVLSKRNGGHSHHAVQPMRKSVSRRGILENMRANQIEVSWDEQHSKWLIRITVGDEVIRRYSEQTPDVDHITLQKEAIDLAAEEGYTFDQADVIVG